MTVKELILKLQELDQDLVVCLEDWQEGYMHPNEDAAEQVRETETKYQPKDGSLKVGLVVVIG